MESVINTEDDVVLNLCLFLETQGWSVLDKKLGTDKGIDIEARRGSEHLLVEAKGAKGGARHTTRNKFDSGQLKTHLGKAIVKCFELRYDYPNATIAIAHPDDEYLKGVLAKAIKEVKACGIKLIWVKSSKKVTIE